MTQYLGKTVMKQFSNSATLLALLNDFDQWVDLSQFSDEFLANVWDISTAQGFGLDIWGRILGQSRYLQIAQTPGDNFGFNINPVGGLVNAINQQFAVGDGVTSVFQLTGPSHEPANNTVVVSSIYRTDWQGNQLLYTVPRTNSYLQSTNLASGSWSQNRVSSVVAATGPDGSNNAAVVTSNGTGSAYLYQGISVTSGTQYELSVFAKAGSTNVVSFQSFTQAGACTFTLAGSGTVGGVSGTISAPTITPLANGWYRCSATFTASATAADNIAAIQLPAASAVSATFFGPQIVALGVGVTAPTSFIPTTGSPVTVTDYSATSGGVVTLGQVLAVGAVPVWNGTFIGAVSGTQWQPWGQAPFYGGATAGTVNFPLQDQYYRQLLLVKAAANIATCDCPSINALMRAMFGNRGRCYVGYDIANPMHIGYHFEFFPTPVEKSIIQSGLFPQPAGTTATYIYEVIDYAPFGFATMNGGADPKYVTGWNQGPFYQPGAAGGDMLNNIGGTFILDQSQMG